MYTAAAGARWCFITSKNTDKSEWECTGHSYNKIKKNTYAADYIISLYTIMLHTHLLYCCAEIITRQPGIDWISPAGFHLMATFHTILYQQACWKSAVAQFFFLRPFVFSAPWGSLTHFHELAQTRRTAIRAATADLVESKRSELALRKEKKKVLKLLARSIFNILIFHSCTVLLLTCPLHWYLS